ncbi:MAG: DUF6094 domain-containing protein [Bacillota bacterium]
MARTASQAKGGFYATPPEEMELLIKRLWVDADAKVNLLDPCAGEGAALRQMADGMASLGGCPVTFGVELEKERAEECRQVLDNVVKGAYEGLRASHEVFSAMWLNPPYDNDIGLERMEVRFLRSLTEAGKYLQTGGLFMYCVPQQILTSAAALLANRFERIKVYRLSDQNYPVFKQVVLFGYRRGTGKRVDTKEVRICLEELGQAGPEDLPSLDAPDGITFDVPAAAGDVQLFRGSLLDPEEIIKDVERSPGWETVERMLLPVSVRKGHAKLKNPVLPLKPAHYAIAIAAGAVGGNLGSHYLEGVTKKVVDRREEVTDTGTTIIESERHVTSIRVFSPEGAFTLE